MCIKFISLSIEKRLYHAILCHIYHCFRTVLHFLDCESKIPGMADKKIVTHREILELLDKTIRVQEKGFNLLSWTSDKVIKAMWVWAILSGLFIGVASGLAFWYVGSLYRSASIDTQAFIAVGILSSIVTYFLTHPKSSS